jgi:hypothetical protein
MRGEQVQGQFQDGGPDLKAKGAAGDYRRVAGLSATG